MFFEVQLHPISSNSAHMMNPFFLSPNELVNKKWLNIKHFLMTFHFEIGYKLPTGRDQVPFFFFISHSVYVVVIQ
jgi:hypothetical protein